MNLNLRRRRPRDATSRRWRLHDRMRVYASRGNVATASVPHRTRSSAMWSRSSTSTCTPRPRSPRRSSPTTSTRSSCPIKTRSTAPSQRGFPRVSELQRRRDGVHATRRRRDAVGAILRESTWNCREPRQFRNGFTTQAPSSTTATSSTTTSASRRSRSRTCCACTARWRSGRSTC